MIWLTFKNIPPKQVGFHIFSVNCLLTVLYEGRNECIFVL